jgi:hypothetical protein
LLNKDPLKWKDIVVELSKQVVSTVDPDVRRQGDQLDVTSYVKVHMCLSLSIYIYILCVLVLCVCVCMCLYVFESSSSIIYYLLFIIFLSLVLS